MRRYDIFEGDKTNVGGKVERDKTHDVMNSCTQAYEGGSVWCPVCKTMGTIGCKGPRISTKGPDGREAALSEDLCLCQCNPSPRLMRSQTISFIDV